MPQLELTRTQLRATLDALRAIGEASLSVDEFARAGVEQLPRLVASELTTLSVCDLDSGHRGVVSDQPGAISPRDIAIFDRFFYAHPLVREMRMLALRRSSRARFRVRSAL